MRCHVIPDHLAALHHEPNALQLRNIRDRISSDGNKIGEFFGLNGTDAVLPAQPESMSKS